MIVGYRVLTLDYMLRVCVNDFGENVKLAFVLIGGSIKFKVGKYVL